MTISGEQLSEQLWSLTYNCPYCGRTVRPLGGQPPVRGLCTCPEAIAEYQQDLLTEQLAKPYQRPESKPLREKRYVCQHCGEIVEPLEAGPITIRGRCMCDGAKAERAERQREYEAEEAKRRAIEERARHEQERQREHERLLATGIPLLFLERGRFADFDRSAQPVGYDAARRFADTFQRTGTRGLIFYGKDYGVGKSHLVAAIALDLHGRGFLVRFTTLSGLYQRVRATFSPNARVREDEVLDEYIRCDLLVLDDIGTEKTSQWTDQILYDVVNARLCARRTIVGTSNLPPYREKGKDNDGKVQAATESLGERIGGRVMDRLAGMCDFVELRGKSWRRRGTA